MNTARRDFFRSAALAGAAALGQVHSKASTTKPGMPGPFPGRVVAVEHSGCIAGNVYQAQPIRQMLEKGMTSLTGAPAWTDAWRSMFEKGDVVGIKVSPVGGKNLCSDASVLRGILDGLKEAGVPAKDVIVFNRYHDETYEAGIDKWIPPGVRFEFASRRYNEVQLDMDGYDEDHYMEIALIKPGESPTDPHFRRSYVAKIVTTKINKLINLPVLKHHQSAGVTIALKNMSHGMVNNVNRSHLTPSLNACGVFIPSVVSLPVIREKAVLHICDARESFLSRRTRRTSEIHVGAQDHVLRDRPGGARQDRMEGHRSKARGRGHAVHRALQAGCRQRFPQLPGGAHRDCRPARPGCVRRQRDRCPAGEIGLEACWQGMAPPYVSG